MMLTALLTFGCGGGNQSTGPSAPQPDFAISIPASVTVTPNSKQTISVSVLGTNSFSSSINLTISGLPAGVVASPATFALTPGTSSSSQTITITADGNVTAAPIDFAVTGTSGSLSHKVAASTSAADFALAVTQPSLSLVAGSSTKLSISADDFNSFTEPVTLALTGLPQGVTVSPLSITLNPGAAQIITLDSAQSMSPGTSTISLQGTSGSLAHNLELTLSVAAAPTPDFSLVVSPSTVTMQAGGIAQSFTVSASGSNGFASPIAVSLTGLPAGVTAMPAMLVVSPGSPQQVSLSASSSATVGNVNVILSGNSGSLTHNATVAVSVQPPADFSLTVAPASVSLQAGGNTQSFTVSASGLHGFTAPIAVALNGLPAGLAALPATFTLTPGIPQQVSLNAASTASAGNASLIVSATSGSLSHSATVTVSVQPPSPDFSLSLNTSSISLPIGGATQQLEVTANAVGTFNSPVNLTITGLPAGVTASPASLTLTPGTAQTVSLQADNTTIAGSATVTLQGVSGTLTHSATLSLTLAPPAPDFQLFVGPPTLNLPVTGNGQFTIALIPFNGFNAAATVTVSGLPTGVSLENPALPLVANIPQSLSIYALSATPGQTPITITATSGTITHTAQVNLVVTTAASIYAPSISAGSDPSNQVASPGMLLAPGTYTFSIVGGGGTTVQFSGLVPGTGLDQNEYTFPGNTASVATFHITITPSAVGERGVLIASFSQPQGSQEVDFPIYVVAQPALIAYVPPLSVQQGGATDIPYELASTSPGVAQVYLGPNWPQNFWLSPYPVNPADQQFAGLSGVEPVEQLFGGQSGQSGALSLSAAGNTASGPTNLSLEFVSGNLSQTIPVTVQVNAYSDFKVGVEPSTVALEAGGTQSFTLSASALGAYSGPIQVNVDDLPAGVQATPQSLTLTPGGGQNVTLTAGSGYSTGGTLSLDSVSGSISHQTQVAVTPGSAAAALIATGTTFSGLGIIQVFNSGTFSTISSIEPYPNAPYPNFMQGILPYVPDSQAYNLTSNCNGNTNSSSCTPVSMAIYPVGPFVSPVSDQPGTVTLNANVPGVASNVVHFDQILPDFTLSFSPANLIIPATGGESFTITVSPGSSAFSAYCNYPSVPDNNGPVAFTATLTAPPNGLSVSPVTTNLCGPGPFVASVSVSADTPPGNYEVTVNAQENTGYQPYYSMQALQNPVATVVAAHSFGIPVTVTAAPPGNSGPSFQLAVSPADVSIAAGQSFPVTVSATVSGTLTAPISVSAPNLPAGVTISPSSFTLNAGASQSVSIFVAPGTAAASDQLTITGTSGSTTGSTQISVAIP